MLLLFSHLIILAICLILKIVGLNDEALGLFFVSSSILATVLYIVSLKGVDKKIKLVVIAGFVVRIILVWTDVFVTRLPDTGTDDDDFYNASINNIDNNYAQFFSNSDGGIFSKLLSVAYFFIGSSRFSAQYLNVLFYVISVVLFIKAMFNLQISKRVTLVVVLILCLMPNMILLNSILRRESIIELCVCASLYNLSGWNKGNNLLNATFSIIFLMLASLFHTVFIFGALILVLYFALYDKNKKAASFSAIKISKMIIVFVCAIIIGLGFLSMWSNKFSSVNDMDGVYTAASRARGGSVYLEGYNVDNLGQLILFTPLKLFYFWFSPVPWSFRGVADVSSFILDTLIYIILLVMVLRSPKTSLSKLVLTVFIVLSIIFALGTFNSGTAIRHRSSLLPFLLFSYSLIERKQMQEEKKMKLDDAKGLLCKG